MHRKPMMACVSGMNKITDITFEMWKLLADNSLLHVVLYLYYIIFVSIIVVTILNCKYNAYSYSSSGSEDFIHALDHKTLTSVA